MNTFESMGLQILIVRPGRTELDEQGRIAGNLDVPLSQEGIQQITELSETLNDLHIAKIYTGRASASRQTAELLSAGGAIKVKVEDELNNLDYGLWHGKRIEELKENQPKLFRLWQEQPQTVCPPDGETVEQVVARVDKVAKRITKKQRTGTVVVVAAEPVACILQSILKSADLGEYWTIEANCGSWNSVIQEAETV